MKRNIITIFGLAMMSAALSTGIVSCGKEKADSKPAAKAKTTATAAALPNYRYIDSDTLLAKYNLSKDFQEQMVRLQNDLESEASKHENQMRSFQSSMQNKMQTNAYTEATYKADESKLQQMGANAQQILGKKQSQMEQTMMNNQKVLNDSIQNFIADYNRAHGYDAIFYKGATVYIDPRLDITDEVVEGLNARYNKK